MKKDGKAKFLAHRGTLLHVRGGALECIPDGVLVVGPEGKIVDSGASAILQRYPELEVMDHGTALLVPGLVDAHVHLPQYPFAGLGADELLPWLERFTFPMEARFSDEAFARMASARFFEGLLQVGTTTAAIYATSSTAATAIAFEAAHNAGIRAIIGKVLMERHGLDAVLEPWSEGVRASEALAEEWHGRDGRLYFAVTPRFAITCSAESMTAAAALAKRRSLYVQTHISESPGEIAFVRKLFPECSSYADVYARCGLLTEKTLLAHCIHLSPEEVRLVVGAGSVMVHCPTSNRYMQSGVFPLRRMEEQGARIALGCDVAGGYDLSLFSEMREAMESSKTWNIFNRAEARPVLSVEEAFRLATLGGAETLGLADRVGNFEIGKEADFLVLDDGDVNSFSDVGLFQEPVERLSRLVYRGRWPVSRTYIAGRQVYARDARLHDVVKRGQVPSARHGRARCP